MIHIKKILSVLVFSLFLLSGILLLDSCESPENDLPLEAADPSGTLFIATLDIPGSTQGTYHVLDAATGEVKWTKPVQGFAQTPTIANGKLFFRNAFDLNALDTATRQITVVANLTDAHQGTPTYYNNKVFVKDGVGEKGYNVFTGSQDFLGATGSGDVSSAATIENGKLISTRANLWGLDAITGNILWTNLDIFPDVFATPAVANSVAYVPAFTTADFYAVSTLNGNLLWDYHFSDGVSMSGTYSSGSPAVKNGKVFFTSFDSFAFALNSASGALVWKKRLDNGAPTASPVISVNRMFLSVGNVLYSINVTNGETVWSVSGPGFQNPVYANGCIFIPSGNTIVCLNASNGAEIWQRDIGTFPCNSLLVVDKNKNVYHPGISGETN